MHINRSILLRIASESLLKMADHRVYTGTCQLGADGVSADVLGIPVPSGVIVTNDTRWRNIRDFRFLLWLTEQIVMLDPMEHCQIVGDLSDWDDIDHAKCMRFAAPGLALPIGNLTSQLFSNVYLNPFDQMIVRQLLCHHYGRYVDDSTMVDTDREWLLAQVPQIREFLADELGLQLHMGKLHVREISQGVEFLGAFVKPFRDYVSRRTLERIEKQLIDMDLRNGEAVSRTVNSYLGIMSHSASYRVRQQLFDTDNFARIVEIDGDMLKSKPIAA